MSDLIKREYAVKTVIRKCSPICAWQVGTQQYPDCLVAEINALPSADAVPKFHEDGTLEVKVPNAVKVGRVLVIDEVSSIGGGLYYPESADDNWIPVSERLPSVGEDVLFCDSKWTEEGCLRVDGDWWQFRWSSVMPKEKVIAWMPLPTPYKGGDDE